MSIFHHDDQPDLTNKPAEVDTRDLHLHRDMNYAHAGNVLRLLEGVRSKDPQFNGAVLRYTIAGARNHLEATLAALDAVEAECLYHLAGRESVLSFPTLPPAKPFGRRRSADAALPATVSVGSL